MAKKKGRAMTLYLSVSTPSDAFDVTEYDAVAFGTQITDNVTRNAVDESDADSGDDSDFQPGRRNTTVTFAGHYDYAADAGQEEAWDAIESVAGKVHFLLTSNVTGDVEDSGSAIVSGFSRTYPEAGIATITINLQQTGARAKQLVPA